MRLLELKKLGQSPWCDYISREFIASGELKKWISTGLLGITSNPTIFEKSISTSSNYDSRILELIQQDRSKEEIYDELTLQDVREAADLFKEIYDRTEGQDGFISIEVLPKYAYDIQKTIESAQNIFERLKRPNILIKVPATKPGIIAIRRLIKMGININATLIFSQRHYREVADAYIGGLKDRAAAGQEVKDIHSVASIFVSRIDTMVDKILEDRIKLARSEREIKKLDRLKGKAAVGNSKIIYRIFKEVISSKDFKNLRKLGANIQRVLWGSTSTKNPAYSDLKYVEELIGEDTINTMPIQTLEAFLDHGSPRLSINDAVDEAEEVIKELFNFGIDIEKVCQALQDGGVKAFSDSFDKLIDSIEEKSLKISKKPFLNAD